MNWRNITVYSIQALALGGTIVLAVTCPGLTLFVAGKVIPAILTGLGLGIGFACKDKLIQHYTEWKHLIEMNLSNGNPWYHNPDWHHKFHFRQDPKQYQTTNEEEMSGDPDIEQKLSMCTWN